MQVEPRVEHIALELTGRCQLTCTHCYAESSPGGDHGSMTAMDWRRVIDQASEYGVTSVQFIGGEPTLHPHFAELVEHALAAELDVEVYTNLVRVTDAWWNLYRRARMSVATSYYTAASARHDSLTGRRGSHSRTRHNIAEAVRTGVRLRVGVIDVDSGSEVDPACEDLKSLGVENIRVAAMQAIGRATRTESTIADLCGRCHRGRAAIGPNGDVIPCVLARWIHIGNVREDHLAEVLSSPRMVEVTADLRAAFTHPDFVSASRCGGGSECPP